MIFGLQEPKLIFDLGGANEATLLLDYTELITSFAESNDIMHEDELSGQRVWIDKGDHASFTIRCYLGEEFYASPDAKLREIEGFRRKMVRFYPHRDGNAISDQLGYGVDFRVTEIKPFYLDGASRYYDMCDIKVVSSQYVSVYQTTIEYLVTESGAHLVTNNQEDLIT
jgi:hypothetical protein